MKGKIISILIMTLLITTGTIVVADWNIYDGFKMHQPQMPNPAGVDIDWGYWYLGDDWVCSESGTVDDIHFWYSTFVDVPVDITSIYVSIWSNNPGPPSKPNGELWNSTFYDNDFHIADPESGDQGWYDPYYYYYDPFNHNKYYQVNIMDITDPFEQEEGETYWLIIKIMDYFSRKIIGWKNSTTQYYDTAVFGYPSTGWTEFYGPNQEKIDLAFVINGGNSPPYDPPPIGPPKIQVGKKYFYTVVTEDPDGDDVSYWFDWDDGTSTPWGPFQASGTSYNRSHIWMVQGDYTIRAKAKDIHGAESGWGELRITVPREKVITSSFFYHLLEQFPILQWLFQRLGPQ
jgi:hypothetical protein